MQELTQVRLTLSNGDIERALTLLRRIAASAEPQLHNEVVLQEGKLQRILKAQRMETIAPDDANRALNRLTASLLDLISVIEKRLEPPVVEAYAAQHRPGPVCISYSWADENIADDIDVALQKHGITIIRDKRDLAYREDIDAFMRRIGQARYVIVVVSDSYLRSRSCMYEMCEIIENNNFKERILPILVPGAEHVFNPKTTVDYVSYWDVRLTDLNDRLKRLDNMAEAPNVYNEIKHIQLIRSTADKVLDALRTTNALTYAEHKRTEYEAIRMMIRS